MIKKVTTPNFRYRVSLSMQSPNIQSRVFLAKMRGRERYGRPN